MTQTERLRRLNALLEQALDLPEAGRTDWLDQVAASDPELLPMLRAMLERAAVETDTFMKRPVALDTGELDGLDTPADQPGDEVGPWRLVSELGAGGMATVWRAERADGLMHRQVALKLPRVGWSSDLARRMARERDILGALEHPNIARLYDAGITAAGRPWLAMESVSGVPIDVYCREHVLDLRARLGLFLQVTDAVAHAHGRLVVHRDLKPSNILVTASGEVRLLDFGVAKLLQHDTAPLPDLTQLLGRALTPDYASPEQAGARPVTVASDVYSLGVVLFELLTGRRPYHLGRVAIDSLERAIIAADVPLASASVPADRALARALRGDLDCVVAKALRKDPGHRYPSVESLATDLRRHLDGAPVLAQPRGRWYRLGKFVRRHRGAVGSAVLVLLAAGAGLAGTWSQALRAEAQAQTAQLERDTARRELGYAEASEAFLRFILSGRSDKPFTSAELLARADQLVDAQYRDDAELRARLQLVVADLYGDQRDYRRARGALERARTSAQQLDARALQARVECRLAEVASASGAAQEADARFEAGMQPLSAAVRDEAEALALCHSGRAAMNLQRVQPQAALDDARRALALLGSPRPAQQAMVVGQHLTIAGALLASGQFDAAIGIYETQLRVAEGGASGLGLLGSAIANNLAVSLGRVGRWQQAADAYRRGRALAADAGDIGDHALLVNHGRLLVDIGRADEAVDMLERARAKAEAAGDPLFLSLAWLGLAAAHCERQDWARCDRLQALARNRMQGAVPRERAIWAAPELLAARIAEAQGDLPLARQRLDAALARFDIARDASPSRVRALGQLARVEALLGDGASARAHADAALAHARRFSAGSSAGAWLGVALLDRATVRRTLGDEDGARDDVAAALEPLREGAGPTAPATLLAERLAHALRR